MARSKSNKAQAKKIDIDVETIVDEVVSDMTTKEREHKSADIVLTDLQAIALDSCKTVSAKIRFLDNEKFDRSAIARFLNKRYQHVRNVLETPLKRVSTN